MNNLLLYLITALGWSLPFFLYKELTKYFNNIDIIILIHIFWHILIVSIVLYITIFKNYLAKEFLIKFKKMPKKYIYYLIFIILIGFISQFSKLYLLKYNNVTHAVPIIRGLSAILIILMGVFIFKEHVTFIKILGILVILIGIFMINKS